MEKVRFLICFKDTVCGHSKKKKKSTNQTESVLYPEGYKLDLLNVFLPLKWTLSRHWNHEVQPPQVPQVKYIHVHAYCMCLRRILVFEKVLIPLCPTWQDSNCRHVFSVKLLCCNIFFSTSLIISWHRQSLHFPIASAVLWFDCRRPLIWQKSNFPMSSSRPPMVVDWALTYSLSKYWNGPVGPTPGDCRRPEGRTGNLLKEKI